MTESTPAEEITVECMFCGDELHTDSLSEDMVMCQCGTTALDHGIVRLFVDSLALPPKPQWEVDGND